jgi:hypothetical protein
VASITTNSPSLGQRTTAGNITRAMRPRGVHASCSASCQSCVVDADVFADQIRLVDGADVEVRIGLPDDSFATAFAQVAFTAPINWQPGAAAAIARQLVERDLGTLLIIGVAATPVLEVIRTRTILAERRGDASTLVPVSSSPSALPMPSKARLVPEKTGPPARVQSIRHRLDGVVAVFRERLQLAHRGPRPPESERSTS